MLLIYIMHLVLCERISHQSMPLVINFRNHIMSANHISIKLLFYNKLFVKIHSITADTLIMMTYLTV